MLRLLAYAVAALLLFVFFNAAIRAWEGAVAVRRFRKRYGAEGKDLLLVYSDDPSWKSYVEDRWLPRWGQRAVVASWPARDGHAADAPELALFRAVSGSRPRTPLAVVVPEAGPITVVRLWRASRAAGAGRDAALGTAEARLEAALHA